MTELVEALLAALVLRHMAKTLRRELFDTQAVLDHVIIDGRLIEYRVDVE